MKFKWNQHNVTEWRSKERTTSEERNENILYLYSTEWSKAIFIWILPSFVYFYLFYRFRLANSGETKWRCMRRVRERECRQQTTASDQVSSNAMIAGACIGVFPKTRIIRVQIEINRHRRTTDEDIDYNRNMRIRNMAILFHLCFLQYPRTHQLFSHYSKWLWSHNVSDASCTDDCILTSTFHKLQLKWDSKYINETLDEFAQSTRQKPKPNFMRKNETFWFCARPVSTWRFIELTVK